MLLVILLIAFVLLLIVHGFWMLCDIDRILDKAGRSESDIAADERNR